MMTDVDFQKDALAFVITFGMICGKTPDECGPLAIKMIPLLWKLREQWVAELDAPLGHAMRDRDAYKANLDEAQEAGTKLAYRVQAQAAAIQKAHDELTAISNIGSAHNALAILKEVMP